LSRCSKSGSGKPDSRHSRIMSRLPVPAKTPYAHCLNSVLSMWLIEN
jgi:hypothetical protein